jgi:hypothetical protein
MQRIKVILLIALAAFLVSFGCRRGGIPKEADVRGAYDKVEIGTDAQKMDKIMVSAGAMPSRSFEPNKQIWTAPAPEGKSIVITFELQDDKVVSKDFQIEEPARH